MPARTDCLLRCVRRMADPAADDAALLTRFLTGRDPAAFEALVARHGPMVLRVCRHVLGNWHDAEDAFQATFLVLARKAGSVRPPSALAAWLHGVAYRVARGARTVARRRPHHDLAPDLAPPDPRPDPLAELTAGEALRVLEEEVQRLPEVYRLPVVLCCLHGLTREEAARQLGWTPGAVKGRLERGRKRLHQRLAGRGLGLAAALALGELSRGTAAGLAPALADATVRAAVGFAAPGHAGACPASAEVLALARSALQHASLIRVKLGLLVLLAVGTVAAGSILSGFPGPAGDPPAVGPADEPAQAARDARPPESSNNQQPPRADRYGDPLPDGAIARLGTLRFHGAGRMLAFSADGSSLISSGDGSARVWDVKTGRELRRLGGGTHPMVVVALSRDGKLLASSHDDGVRLWDPATGKPLAAPPAGNAYVGPLAVSPDGKRLATGDGDSTVMVWDLVSETKIGQFTAPRANHLVFSPDGKGLAFSGWDQQRLQAFVQVWDVVAGKQLYQVPLGPASFPAVTFSPDGKILATGAKDQSIQLWDRDTGKELGRLVGHEERPFAITFSPDGRTLASGGMDGTVRLWDVAGRREQRRCQVHAYSVDAITFSPDGIRLAVSADGIIRLWDAATGRELRSRDGQVHAVSRVGFTPDGKSLVSVGDDQIALWDPFTGRQLHTTEDHADEWHLALSPDGKTLATFNFRDLAVRLWDVASGKEVRRLPGKKYAHGAFAPDGGTLAVAWDEDVIQFFDLSSGKEVRRLEGQHGYGPIVFAPDGRTLLAVNQSAGPTYSPLQLWDPATGKEVWHLDPRSLWGGGPQSGGRLLWAAFSPDGRIVAGTGVKWDTTERSDGVVFLWEAATGKEIRRWARQRGQGGGLAFAPDGRTLATSSWDRAIQFWEVATAQERRPPLTVPAAIGMLSFSPDGRLLVSTDGSSTALVWDLTGRIEDGVFRPRRLSPKELDACWADLAGADAARAYQAVLALASAPEQAVPFLRERLRPVTAAEPRRVAALLAGLDSSDFGERDRAEQGLAGLGSGAEPALRAALAGDASAEVRRRVERVLERLEGSEALRVGRAVEALEQTGTPEARQALEAAAGGLAEARLTREAKASLERLSRRYSVRP